MPFNIDVRKISDTEANLSSSTKVYDNNFQLWPTDGANFGKYKQCDGIHTYSQLAFQDPTVAWGSGGGGPASALTQDEVDGIQANNPLYPLSAINGVVSGDEMGSALAANSSNRIRYQFDTATGDADPGAGKFRLNNGTIGSATLLYISETDREGNALSALLDTLGTAGTLVLRQFGGTDVASFTLGTITDASGYKKIGVTLVQGSLPANDDEFIMDVWGVLPTRASLGVPNVYFATLSNLGAITVDSSYNQLGGTPAWATVGGGEYTLTITGAFTAGKTFITCTPQMISNAVHLGAVITSADVITVHARDADGASADPAEPIYVKVEIYP